MFTTYDFRYSTNGIMGFLHSCGAWKLIIGSFVHTAKLAWQNAACFQEFISFIVPVLI